MKNIILLIGILLAFPNFGLAATYNIDPSHSQVGFGVKHLFSNVPGRFVKYTGTIEYDEKNVPKSSVTAEIDVTSINTDNEKRDNHLRSADFFDTAKFPKMMFKSTSVKKVGKDKLAVTGDLTMRDKTKVVTLDVELLGFGSDPWGNHLGGFHAKTKINRKDFGLTWNKTLDSGGLLLGEEVTIEINVEAKKVADAPRKEPPAAAKN